MSLLVGRCIFGVIEVMCTRSQAAVSFRVEPSPARLNPRESAKHCRATSSNGPFRNFRNGDELSSHFAANAASMEIHWQLRR